MSQVSFNLTSGKVAFATITTTAMAGTASLIAAAKAVSTVAAVAFGVLGITLVALSGAAIIAYMDPSTSDDPKTFWNHFKASAGHAVAGAFHLVAQAVAHGFAQGMKEGVSTKVRRGIAGPDQTVEIKNT